MSRKSTAHERQKEVERLDAEDVPFAITGFRMERGVLLADVEAEERTMSLPWQVLAPLAAKRGVEPRRPPPAPAGRGKRNKQRRRHLHLGENYVRQGEGFRFLGIKRDHDELLVQVQVDSEVVWVRWRKLVGMVAGSEAKEGEAGEPLPYDARTRRLLQMLSPVDRLYAATVIEHLCEVKHGDRYGSLTAARPEYPNTPEYDPNYDPALTTVEDRIALKAPILAALGEAKDGGGWSRSNFYRKMSEIFNGGPRGLTVLWNGHSRAKLRAFSEIVDPRVWEALEETIKRHTSPGVGSTEWPIRDGDFLAQLALRGVGPEGVSEPMRRDLYDYASAGKFLDDPGSTKTSKSSRPERPFGHRLVLRPLEVVEIDSTALNLFCSMPDGKPINAEVLTAVDVCTRMVLALRVVPQGASSQEIKYLLFDMYAGAFCRKWGLDMRSSLGAMPEHLVVPEGFIQIIKSLTADRGPQMDSYETMATLQAMGTDVNQTPVRTGTAKAVVESLHNNWKYVTQGLPGDKGASVRDKGDQHGALPGPTMEQAEEFMWEWCTRVYHLAKQQGLRDPLDHRRRTCPLDAWMNHIRAGAIIRVPMDENTVVGFLTHDEKLATRGGIETNGGWYNGRALDGMRAEERGARQGPVAIRYDPRRKSQVLVYNDVREKWLSIKKVRTEPANEVGQDLIVGELREARAGGEQTNHSLTETQRRLETGTLRDRLYQQVVARRERQARQERASRAGERRQKLTLEKQRRAEATATIGGLPVDGGDADVVDLDAERHRRAVEAAQAASAGKPTFRFEDAPWSDFDG